MNKKIIFKIGEESRPIIEDLSNNQIKNSIFFDQYQKALLELERYLVDNESTKSSNSNERQRINKGNEVIYQNDNFNNIFAFIGDRGAGKTSLMLSLSGFLQNGIHDENVFSKGLKKINHEKFHCLDIIDPSFFDKKNNIIGIFIAKLFHRLKWYLENEPFSVDMDKKEKLISKFESVQRDLKYVLNTNVDIIDDDVEYLSNLSASVDLRRDIKNLIDIFLEFVKSDYLVLMVDDIDLQIENAYEMTEQIRKYLIQPNMVILMSLKMDQLSNIVAKKISKDMDDKVNSMKYMDMTDRYLNKVFPIQHRFFLPEVESFMDRALEIWVDGVNKNLYSSVKETVPALIFRKTRYLFYNTKGVPSYVIPRNMRELRHLIKLLWIMDERKESLPYNKLQFKKYFYESWTKNNLNPNGIEFIESLLDVTDAAIMNKVTVNLLRKHFDIKADGNDEISKEIKKIIDADNISYNISLGDVMGIVYHLEKTVSSLYDKKLLFMVKSIYSIRLYEYYDEMTEIYQHKEELKEENRKPLNEVYRIDTLEGYNNYVKLVGGNFINTTIAREFLPSTTDPTSKYKYRVHREINGAALKELIDKIIDKVNSLISLGEGNVVLNDLEGSIIEYAPYKSIDLVLAIQVVEFFLMTTSYSEGTLAYRKNNDIYYDSELSGSGKYIFDITSIFYNIIDFEKSCNRVNRELYNILNIIDKNGFTLSNQINSNTFERHLNSPKWRYLSTVSIRNIEVLQSMVEYLEQNKPKGDAVNSKVVSSFFYNLCKEKNHSGFKILTYDFDENGNHYNISYSFFKPISDFLRKTDIYDLFDRIFVIKANADINININLRGNGPFSKYKISELLLNKNKEIDREILENLIDDFFVKDIPYSKEMAADHLKNLKLKNKLNNN